MIPQTEKMKFHIYGIWNDNKQIVIKDGKKYIRDFDEIDEALAYMRKQTLSNKNIIWCITSDSEYINRIIND